ncbi:MAG: NDP-sugar synthase [Candidatus Sericytochromatia bacterium]|nr:NDP-sugar synthase [Candidatus Sericytochromatia bacterium]
MDTLTALICLAGSPSWSMPLLHVPVPFLVPFCNQPLLKIILLRLKSAGVERVVFVLDDLSASWLHPLRPELARTGLVLDYMLLRHLYDTESPLRDELLDRLPLEQPVLLLQDPFPDTVDITAFLAFHREKQADCSVRLLPGRTSSGLLQPVYTDGEDLLSLKEGAGLRPAQDARMYLLETDILEDMLLAQVPLLKAPLASYFGENVPYCYGYTSQRELCIWHSLAGYLQRQKDFLAVLPFQPEGRLLQKTEKTQVWLGEGSVCEELPQSEGAIFIGRHCKIGKNVKIQGPVFLGDHVQIGAGTQLKNVTIWSQTQVGARCQLSDSLLASRASVASDCRLQAALVADQAHLGPGQSLKAGDTLGPFSRLGLEDISKSC